jgi:uridine kinase
MNVKLIGIAGGSGSGKSTVVKKIISSHPGSICIEQDSYYKSASFINNSNITAFNFDHPDAFDTNLMLEHLEKLKQGIAVDIPQYDFVTHSRKEDTTHIEPKPIIVVDGLMVLYDKRLRDMFDLKLYVDTPADVRFIRRLERDVKERGRTMESVIKQYLCVVRPGHMNFIEPTKEYADLIIPEGGYNAKALNVLLSFVREICNS